MPGPGPTPLSELGGKLQGLGRDWQSVGRSATGSLLALTTSLVGASVIVDKLVRQASLFGQSQRRTQLEIVQAAHAAAATQQAAIDATRKHILAQQDLAKAQAEVGRVSSAVEKLLAKGVRNGADEAELRDLTKAEDAALDRARSLQRSVADRKNDVVAALHEKGLDNELQAAQRVDEVRALQRKREVELAGLALTPALVLGGLIKQAVGSSYEFNRTLYQANSSLVERNRLFSVALDTQLRTGVSLKQVAEVQETLRARGLLYLESSDQGLRSIAKTGDGVQGTFGETVIAATQLSKTFGVSGDQLESLLATAATLHTSLSSTGDLMTQVVERTTLGVQDFLQITADVRETAATLGLGLGGRPLDLGPITKQAAALQEGLVQAGEPAPAATDLTRRAYRALTDTTTNEGLRMHALFGADPRNALDASSFSKSITTLLERLKGYGVGGPITDAYQARTQSQLLQNLTGGVLSLSDVHYLAEAQHQRLAADTDLESSARKLQERYDSQAIAAGESWGMLKTQLLALSSYALRPAVILMQSLNAGLSALGKSTRGVIDWFDHFSGGWGTKTLTTLGIIGKLEEGEQTLGLGGAGIAVVGGVATALATSLGLRGAATLVNKGAFIEDWLPRVSPGLAKIISKLSFGGRSAATEAAGLAEPAVAATEAAAGLGLGGILSKVIEPVMAVSTGFAIGRYLKDAAERGKGEIALQNKVKPDFLTAWEGRHTDLADMLGLTTLVGINMDLGKAFSVLMGESVDLAGDMRRAAQATRDKATADRQAETARLAAADRPTALHNLNKYGDLIRKQLSHATYVAAQGDLTQPAAEIQRLLTKQQDLAQRYETNPESGVTAEDELAAIRGSEEDARYNLATAKATQEVQRMVYGKGSAVDTSNQKNIELMAAILSRMEAMEAQTLDFIQRQHRDTKQDDRIRDAQQTKEKTRWSLSDLTVSSPLIPVR